MADMVGWSDGSRTALWARAILPVLVRQARAGVQITYGALAREVGMDHHRPVYRAAGHVGWFLAEIGKLPGWRSRPPPPLQALIVNKRSGEPGSGLAGFLGAPFRRARSDAGRRAILAQVRADLAAYPFWGDVLGLAGVDDSAGASVALAVAAATRAPGGGGEGVEHDRLKRLVARTPSLVGVEGAGVRTRIEYGLPSGDRVDVAFVSATRIVAVEIKSVVSSEKDIARGLFQCVKYRAVLEACSALRTGPPNVVACLALGGPLPNPLAGLANALAVKVVDCISLAPSAAARPASRTARADVMPGRDRPAPHD